MDNLPPIGIQLAAKFEKPHIIIQDHITSIFLVDEKACEPEVSCHGGVHLGQSCSGITPKKAEM